MSLAKWKVLLLISSCFLAKSAVPAMPPAIHDDGIGVSAATWGQVAHMLLPALECRKTLDLDDPAIKRLLSDSFDPAKPMVPPRGVSVWGLPVQEIRMEREDTASGRRLVSTVAVPAAMAKGLLMPRMQGAALVGEISVTPGAKPSLSNVICTIRE